MRAPDSDTAIAHLAACPLFAELSPTRLARLAEATTERHHANGEVIHHKGDLPAALLVVQSGRIKETCLSPEGDERVIEILQQGHTCGEAALLLGQPLPFAVVALANATLLHIDWTEIHALLDDEPSFVRRMLSSLSVRLHTLVRDVESYTLQPPVQRVAGYLADLIEPLADDSTVPLPAAKKVIASRLGMTPEAFSRALRDLADAGMIKVSLQRITVKHPRRLRELTLD